MNALTRSRHGYPRQQGYKNVLVRMAPNSKTGGGDPVSVRLEPSAPLILGVKKPFDEKSGGFSFNFGPAHIGPVHQVNSVKVGPGPIFL